MRKIILFSILDQGVLSAFNFFLALLLIKHWSREPEIFGIYSVILALSLTVISVQNALVLGQLTVMRPRAADGGGAHLLSMFWTVNVAVTGVAVLVTSAGTAAVSGKVFELAMPAALFVGATLLREYTRIYHFSKLDVVPVLALDILSLLLSVALLALAWAYDPPLDLRKLFLILALSQTLASLPAISASRENFQIISASAAWDAYRDIWLGQSRWALLSVLTTEFQQRGYVFVVALAFGPADVALLQAAALLFRPVQLVTQAWGKPARAILAGHFAHGRDADARRFTLLSLAGLGLLFFAFLGCIAVAWPHVRAQVFRGYFANLEDVIAIWGVATAVIMTTGVFSIEAQSLMKFRELSAGAMGGAAACGLTLAIVVAAGDFRGSVLAVIAGQLVLLLVIWRTLSKGNPSVPSLGGESQRPTVGAAAVARAKKGL